MTLAWQGTVNTKSKTTTKPTSKAKPRKRRLMAFFDDFTNIILAVVALVIVGGLFERSIIVWRAKTKRERQNRSASARHLAPRHLEHLAPVVARRR